MAPLVTYWVAAVTVTAFGFLTGFSIGAPFLIVGVAMLILGPVRRSPRLFWPPFVGVIVFVITVVLFVPLYCVATSDLDGISQTVCTSIAGPTWSGPGLYNPPPEAFSLAFRDGVVTGVGAAIMTLAWITFRRRESRHQPTPA